MCKINLVLLFLCCAGLAQAQYIENFNGQNGKGLVNAICPAGTTNIANCGSACTANATDNTSTCATVPVSLTGVNWNIVRGPATSYFTTPLPDGFGFEYDSPDDFGVVGDRMQVDDPDNEICWLSPTLNIASAGAVTISVAVSQTGNLESNDYIKGEYSLNGGAFVQFGIQTGAFAATTLTASGLTGSTLVIRICALTNGAGEQIFFDDVSVPQTGVSSGCAAPTISRTTFPTGTCNPSSGAIQVTASGGTPGYNVAWSGPSSGNPSGTEIASANGSYTIPSLAAGTYTITVTDAATCSATTTATVGTATPLSLSTQVLPASCSSVDDGEIDLTVSNGVAPYTYSWDNLPGAGDPQDQTNLAPATYFVTVTDNAGCTATTSATVGVATPGAYSETFSIAGKGILDGSTCSGASGTTCTNNNFTGVNWTIYGLSNLTGVDAGDYFKTTGGVLQALDLDQIVCWESPELDINPPGSGVSFSVALSWANFDHEPAGPNPPDNIGDHLDVEYSLNGGAWQRVSNQVGGGLTGHTISYLNGAGNDVNGSTTVNVSGLTGSTLRIRVCGLANGDTETFSIDNVTVSQAQGLACPQEINLKQSVTNIPSGGSYNYGNVNLGSNNSKVFTIENTGSFTLTLTGTPPNYVVKGGTNPGDFTITQPVTGTITGDNSTTFTVVFTPGGLGGRSCTLSIGNSDSNENPYTLTLNGTGVCPGITFTGTPTATCIGTTNGQIVVSGVTGGTAAYQYSKDNGANYQPGATFTGLAPGTYQVVVKDANNCTSGATAVTVGSLPAPNCLITGPPFPGSHDTLCIGSTYVYTAPPGMDSYSWSVSSNGTIVGSSTSQTMSVTVNSGSFFTAFVTITNANGCVSNCSLIRPVQVAPTVCEINGPTPVCVNSSGNVYTVNTGSFSIGSYSWSVDGNGMPSGPTNGNSVSVTAGVAGTYTVNVTLKASFNTCTTLCSKTVTVNTGASAGTITGNNSLCAGTTTDLNNTGPSGGAWSSSNTGVATVNSSGLVSGLTAGMTTIAYTVTDGTGCSSSTSMVVTVIGPPDPGTLSPLSPTLCIGATLTMSSTVPGGTWRSNNPATASIVSATGLLTGLTAVPSADTSTIFYTVDNGCFERSAWTQAKVLPLPNAGTISGTPSVCIGQTTTLSSNGLGGGTWSSDDLTAATVHPSTGVVTGVATGTATITYAVTDGNQCSSSTSVVVTVNGPTPSVVNGPALVCGSSTGNMYSTTPGMSAYLWSVSGNASIAGSSTGSTVSVTANATGTYTVSVAVTNSSGCIQNASKVVNISPLPAATITPSENPYCISSPYLILTTPTAATGTVQWSGSSGSGIYNSGYLSTLAFPTVTGMATYYVTVTTVDGCSNSGSVQVEIIDIPVCPSTYSPANGATGTGGNVVLSWNAVAGASGYRITMGDNAPNYNNIANNVDLGNITSYDPLGAGDLPPGATYGYTITPYNSCGSATGCSLQTFNTCVESFVCPGPQNVNLNAACAFVVPDLIGNLTSNCGTLTFTQDPAASTVVASSHNAATTVTITASNNTSCTVTLTAYDLTPPAVSCKPATVVLNGSGTGSVSMAQVFLSGSDNCGTLNQQSVAPSDFGCANVGTNLVVLTVNDGHGNTNTCSATVTVTDNTAPSITCPGPVTVNCSGNIPPVNLNLVTATENCGTVTKSHLNDSAPYDQSCANRYKITRTYRATDQSNNSTTCSQVITVADYTAPSFTTVPANVTVQCNALPTVGAATATDNCGGAATVSYNGQSIQSGSCLDSYTIVRQWTATDACGNTKSTTQVITVRDTQAPTFTGSPANITVQCNSIPAPGSATATDNCDALVAITYNGQTRTNGACTDSYVLTRRWTAADNCGNTKTITQRITVQDTQKPVFTSVPANSSIQCSDTPPPPGAVTATDNCDLGVTVTYLGESTTGGTCSGAYLLQRTWLAVDNCGNSTAATQTITVQDTQAPAFTSVPGDVTIQCSDLTPPIGTATATDACGGYVQVLFQGQTMTQGTCLANRTLIRTWIATDECANSVTASQRITIQDTQAPSFSNAPANVTVLCGNVPTVPAVLAIDNCDTYVPVTYLGESSTGPSCPYTLTRRWTVADDCGNAVTHTQVITVAASLQNNPSEESLMTGTPTDASVLEDQQVWSRQAPDDVSFSLVPNPAAHEVWVSVTAVQEDQAILTLFDAGGRMPLRQVSGVAKGENRYRLDLTGLPSGLYTVQVVLGGQAHSKKLMILQD